MAQRLAVNQEIGGSTPLTPAKPKKELLVKRSDIHFGEMVYCKGLYYTQLNVGISSEMKEFIQSFITVEQFSCNRDTCIEVISKNGQTFVIHEDDLIKPEDIEELGEALDIVINNDKEIQFDETRLVI